MEVMTGHKITEELSILELLSCGKMQGFGDDQEVKERKDKMSQRCKTP